MRSLSKLMLNSFWGKFGQRSNQGTTKIVSDDSEYYRCMADPTQKLTDFFILSEDLAQLKFKKSEQFVPQDFKTNVFLASFTTA